MLNITNKSIKFYNNWSAQAANNFWESAMSNLSKPIEFAHLQKLANHKKLNGAHMIEVTNECIAVLTKARNSMIFWSIEKPEKRRTEKKQTTEV